MKKTIACLLTAVLLASLLLAGCAGTPGAENDRLHIVCTIFPEYDWLMQLLGEHANDVDVTFLLDSGTDLHSYQPTADDLIAIRGCDLFIYTGGESDRWVDDVLRDAPEVRTVNLLAALGDRAKAEEPLEGMQPEEEEEDALDEHIWLSLKNAAVLAEVLAQTLTSLDPDFAAVYEENLASFLASAAELDREYETSVAGAQYRTVLFADRFPFRYLMDDYGLTAYAAFSGCSAETEASFETVTFLVKKTQELALPAVLVTETSDQSIARTVVGSTETKDQTIVVLDSMQSVTAKKAAEGYTYLDAMRANLQQLRIALGYADEG